MNKEQQDLSWTCLPKEVREEIRRKYKIAENDIDLFIQTLILDDIFGIDNLTSDTEPSELLFVERKKILEYYKDVQQAIGEENGDTKIEMEGRKMAMRYFFGDKCLPNKEPSVQVEPKFRKGDLVKCKTDGIIYKVKRKSGLYHYHLKGKDNPVHINWLEPYTEPETKDNMKKNRCEKCGANAQQCADSPCQDYPLEEKELNLCELLKGYEGEYFYCPIHNKDVKLRTIATLMVFEYGDGILFNAYKNGSTVGGGKCMIFPSRTLYEKYPLDPYSAWMEWKEERKPKYILEVEVSSWFDGEDGRENEEYDGKKWFKFDSAMELKQAAEAVRECLEKFHESKNE